MHVATLFSEMNAVMEIQGKISELGAYSFPSSQETRTIASFFAGIQSLGILAVLYFMWTVRHPRTDDGLVVNAVVAPG
jgi:hypothetical protein